MSTFGLTLACGDDITSAGGETSGLAETGDGTEGLDGMDGMEGMEDGDVDGDSGDANEEVGEEVGDGDGDSGDGDSGDGDGDSGDGDGDSGDGDGDSGDGDGDSGDGDGDSGDGDGDSGDGDGDSGDGDGDAGFCGDGLVDAREQCDDGNNVSLDGCAADCTLENIGPGIKYCGTEVYACGDTLDNDMDGLIDLDDPECTTPCDDDEGTFKTSLPGQNLDCKSDCYFDKNSGNGDDGCDWNLKCDPENPGAQIGCAYEPNFPMCGDPYTPQACQDFCEPLVPSGCDCFGCCEFEGHFVYLGGADCTLDTIDECESCTFVEDCANPCDPNGCELCFAWTPQDLPPECE